MFNNDIVKTVQVTKMYIQSFWHETDAYYSLELKDHLALQIHPGQ